MTATVRRFFARRPRSGQFAFWAGLTVFFLAASIVQTWPLAKHIGDSVIVWPHRPEDAWLNIFNLWWIKESLTHLENPYETPYIFYPQGADLYLHTLVIVNGVMSVPLQMITRNVILSWNILMLALLAASGLATYALAFRVTGSRLPSLLAGYIFAFSPFVMMRLHGHWNISTVWMLPIFALFLLRFQQKGRWLDAALAGLFGALITYNHQEYGTDALLFLGIFFLFWTAVYVSQRRFLELRRLLLGIPVSGAVWFIVGAPLLIPALSEIFWGDTSSVPIGGQLVTDPLALITVSPLWGAGELPSPVPDGSQHFPPGDIENTVYLGFTPLLAGLFALLTTRRPSSPAVFWLIVFATFTVLAFGPYLFLGDTKDFTFLGFDFSVPLPYQLYEQLPVFGERRGISRLIVFGHLALAILAAIGADTALRYLKSREVRWSRAAPVLGVVLVALVAFEYWSPPNALTNFIEPEGLEIIADDPGDFAVIHAPVGRSTWFVSGNQGGAVIADYWVTITERRSVGGYISRAPDADTSWLDRTPGISYLACPGCEGRPTPEDLNADAVLGLFEELRIKYVAVHRLTPHGWLVTGEEEIARLEEYVAGVLGFEEIYRDDAMTLFRNPGLASGAAFRH